LTKAIENILNNFLHNTKNCDTQTSQVE